MGLKNFLRALWRLFFPGRAEIYYLAHVVEVLDELLPPERRMFIPCTPQEITALENSLKYPLPAVYKEYLRLMGRRSAPLFGGTDRNYADLFNLQNGAKELLLENQFPHTLPDNSFVFAMHQGYIFYFFYLNPHEPDPPVYGFHEADTKDNFDLPPFF